MARPSKLTPEVAERIIAGIRAGNYAEPSARAAGISPATFYRWLKAGEEAKSGACREFYEGVKQAEAQAEVEIVARLRKAVPEDWRAGLTILERRYSSRWGRRQAHEHSGPGGGPVLREVIFSDPDTRRYLDDALRAAARARAGGTGGPRSGQ